MIQRSQEALNVCVTCHLSAREAAGSDTIGVWISGMGTGGGVLSRESRCQYIEWELRWSASTIITWTGSAVILTQRKRRDPMHQQHASFEPLACPRCKPGRQSSYGKVPCPSPCARPVPGTWSRLCLFHGKRASRAGSRWPLCRPRTRFLLPVAKVAWLRRKRTSRELLVLGQWRHDFAAFVVSKGPEQCGKKPTHPYASIAFTNNLEQYVAFPSTKSLMNISSSNSRQGG